ncbi:hypothetical protein N9937_00755 [bacterium]|nr:hypothetical protein [bacterium]
MTSMPVTFTESGGTMARCNKLTSEQLTLPHCQNMTVSVEDSPAKTSVPLEMVQGSRENGAVFSGKSLGLRYIAKLHGCSWKTCQQLLQGGWEPFSGTWPKAGSMRNGTVYQRQPLVPHIEEIGSGFWPTPNVCDSTRGTPETPEQKKKRGANTGWSLIDVLGYTPHPEFAEWLMGLPIGHTDLSA